jgi:hypothetical protein
MCRSAAAFALLAVSVGVGGACPRWGRCGPPPAVVVYPYCPPPGYYYAPCPPPVIRVQPLTPSPETKTEAVNPEDAPDRRSHVRGRVVYGGDPLPVQKLIPKSGGAYTEDWVVNPTNRGVRNVVVWLGPELTRDQLDALQARRLRTVPSFRPDQGYPGLPAKSERALVLGEPARAYVPHVVVAQAGSALAVRNLSPVPQNVKWDSRNNGQFDVLLAPGQSHREAGLTAERTPIEVQSSIYPWMRAYLWVLDHPYFAVTNEDGEFEIKYAPRGELRLVVWQEAMGFRGGREGRWGEPIRVSGGQLDLGEIKLKPPEGR